MYRVATHFQAWLQYGGDSDDATTTAVAGEPTAAPTESEDGDNPICLLSAALCLGICIPVLILEVRCPAQHCLTPDKHSL